jgi:hypothetical protein
MVRGVEERLGPVVAVNVPKDVDTHKPLDTMFLTLLRPATILDGEPIHLQVPLPEPTPFRGGPAFGDFSAVLRGTIPGGKGASKVMRFNVEARRSAPLGVRARGQRIAPSKRDESEDEAIVRALAAFGGGFNGGLEGIAERFGANDLPPVEASEPIVEEPLARAPLAKLPKKKAAPKVEEDVQEEVAEASGPEKPKISRAERTRMRAIENARRSAQHAASAEQETPSAEESAGEAQEFKEEETVLQEEDGKQSKGGLFGSLFGRK